MADRDAVAEATAEQCGRRNAEHVPGEVVDRDVERGFGVGIAFDRHVHRRVDGLDIGRIRPFDRRPQVVVDQMSRRLWRLAVVAHVRAAPRRDRRCLSPADDAVVIDDLHDQVTADRRRHLARPVVRTPLREVDDERLDFAQAHFNLPPSTEDRRL